PDLDFLYYSNDMIGAGGMLHCLDAGFEIPDRIGLAGFNGVELLDGFSCKLATMDAGRLEIGRAAAEIIAKGLSDQRIELEPKLNAGDTLGRKTIFPAED
ncbi:MAG: substrate-binding domain-containing protein, partial [Alphaproteobacteria bacterium]|nr:substrate-binding domain-containing protein [Alphaproteobacteria bacterium]